METIIQDNLLKIIITTIIGIIALIIYRFLEKGKGKKEEVQNMYSLNNPVNNNSTSNAENNFNQIINLNNGINSNVEKVTSQADSEDSIEKRKKLTKILFIDDDLKFKVVNILKKSGWINTYLIKDIDNIDDIKVKDADIFFVDIQGVGKALGCNDEGLGLALTLNKKYPNKKIVIYSAETKGDRFHDALKKADSFLSKNAEPYEFQQLVEQYSKEIYPYV